MILWREYAPELLTDLYELTMAATYFEEGMSEEATFSLFVRDYPPDRAYFVAAGLEHVIDLVTNLSFGDESLSYLESTGKFTKPFLDYLGGFRFTGSIRAIPEGRIFFAQEPILEVTAPIIEGQIIETLILNVIQLETMLAGKAARCVHAARGRPLIDFGFRRTHGVEAGVKAARAAYLTGYIGTSNLLAGKIYGIPVFGTMAHSFVTSFEREMDSFLAFARVFPENTVLLIDTYDTVSGAHKAVETARIMASEGLALKGVRLDSGDLISLSKKVREIFREAGFPDVAIMASGNLDEYKVDELLRGGAEIDFFAVGTRVGVSADAPYLDIAYKLVEYSGRPILKLSSGKKTWVGKKRIQRFYDDHGRMEHDLLTLLEDEQAGGEPLLELVVEGGKPARAAESLDAIRARFAGGWKRLPLPYRDIRPTAKYPVRISDRLQELDKRVSNEKRRVEMVPEETQ